MTLDARAVVRALQAEPTARIDVGHSQVAYYRFGQGPDVVFVHGWPVHSATFRKIVPELAPSLTCHLFDLPGAGQTRCHDDSAIALAPHTETLRRVVDHLGLQRYALLAQDSGGIMAREVAASDPRVNGLVLGNTELPGHRPWLIEAYAKLAQWRPLSRLITRGLSLRALRRSPLVFGNIFFDRSLIEGEVYDLFIAPLLRSPAAADQNWALLRNLDYAPMDRFAEVHAKIRVPTLLIWGARDSFFPVEKARRMRAEFGGPVHWHEIDRAKLFVHEERPAEFAALARPFLLDCAK